MTAPANPRPWALYGPTGVTGRLILEQALARGHRPTLVGRNRTALDVLAAPAGLPVAVARVDEPDALVRALEGHRMVVNAAGPFRLTARPLIDAAIATGADYLDVNGEIDALNDLLAQSDRAADAGVVLMGAAAFGVAATDALARVVSETLGGAEWLRLAVAVETGTHSPAVAESTIDAIRGGGREIAEGQLQRRRLAVRRWTECGADGAEVAFASAPLADILAARLATGAPTIWAGVPMPAAQALAVSTFAPLLPPLTRLEPVRRALVAASGHAASGEGQTRPRCRTWVTGGRGALRRRATLEAGEGFDLAVDICLRTLEALDTRRPEPGAYTPAAAFGMDIIQGARGVTITLPEPA